MYYNLLLQIMYYNLLLQIVITKGNYIKYYKKQQRFKKLIIEKIAKNKHFLKNQWGEWFLKILKSITNCNYSARAFKAPLA